MASKHIIAVLHPQYWGIWEDVNISHSKRFLGFYKVYIQLKFEGYSALARTHTLSLKKRYFPLIWFVFNQLKRFCPSRLRGADVVNGNKFLCKIHAPDSYKITIFSNKTSQPINKGPLNHSSALLVIIYPGPFRGKAWKRDRKIERKSSFRGQTGCQQGTLLSRD